MTLTITSLVKSGTQILKDAGIENAAQESKILLQATGHLSPLDVIRNSDESLSSAIEKSFFQGVYRRAKHEPIAKIVGYKDFWKKRFFTTHDTLDPRPDSETVIDLVLKCYTDKSAPLRILELGCGTGCLILSLLEEYPKATGVAVDISEQALDVARKNTQALGFGDQLQLFQSNWFEHVTGTYDLILSNPPYLSEHDLHNLQKDARFDPSLALSGGPDGLSCYRILFQGLSSFLAPDGLAVFEMGLGQLNILQKLAASHDLQTVRFLDDLGGVPRALALKKGKSDA